MPKALKRIFSLPKNLPFLKESLLSVAVRSVSALTVGKIIAVNFGPAGTALFSQLINLFSGFSNTGADGLGRAVVKYGSGFEGQGDEKGISGTIGAGLGLLAILLGVQWLILLLVYFTTGWSVEHFEGIRSVWVWGFFSLVTIGYFVGYLYLIRRQTQWQAFTTTSLSIGALAGLGLGMLLHVSLQNALLCLFGCQALAGLISATVNWNKLRITAPLSFDRTLAKGILAFAFTIASTGVLARLSDYGLIQWAISRFGDVPIGIWLAMNKIADSMNIPVLVVVNSIMFPILASKKDSPAEIREFLRPLFRQGFLAISAGILLVLIFYPMVLNVLFSSVFKADNEWKYLQLTGDFFRTNAYLIAVLPLAVGHTRFYLFLELGSIAAIVLVSVFLGEMLGFKGLFAAHAIRYFLYWLILAIRYRSLIF